MSGVPDPKLRTGSFYPSLMGRRRQVDQALFAVVMEAYLHGCQPVRVTTSARHLVPTTASLRGRCRGYGYGGDPDSDDSVAQIPVLALAALPGTTLGRLGEPSTASSAAWDRGWCRRTHATTPSPTAMAGLEPRPDRIAARLRMRVARHERRRDVFKHRAKLGGRVVGGSMGPDGPLCQYAPELRPKRSIRPHSRWSAF